MSARHHIVPVSDLKSAEEVLANVRATRERLQAEMRKAQIEDQRRCTEERLRRIQRIQKNAEAAKAALEQIDMKKVFDHAIDRFGIRDWLIVHSRSTPESWLRSVCRERRIDIDEITGGRQYREVSEIRGGLIAEMRQKFPSISIRSIGTAFNRDHATIIYWLKKKKLRS